MGKRITTLLLLLCATILSAQPIRVACVGDSITYGLRIIDRKSLSYPKRLQELLGEDYKVENFGANSATAGKKGNRPYTEKSIYTKSLAYEPDIVLLLLGTNDSKKQNWRGAESYMQDLLDIARSYASLPSSPRVFLLTPPKAFSGYLSINDAHIQQEANAIFLQELYPVIDLRLAFCQHREWISSDGIHPNAEGASAIAALVAEQLQETAMGER